MHPLIPVLLDYNDIALLLMRILVAAIFFQSGLSHVRDPEGRAKSIGMSVGFTLILGCAELAGAVGVALGVFPQLAAIGLILIMLGAIQKKIFEWHTGFWAKNLQDGTTISCWW